MEKEKIWGGKVAKLPNEKKEKMKKIAEQFNVDIIFQDKEDKTEIWFFGTKEDIRRMYGEIFKIKLQHIEEQQKK